ncbi:MAG: hypothetical protein ACRBBP_03205 [Bdellovibrionales bacterium]
MSLFLSLIIILLPFLGRTYDATQCSQEKPLEITCTFEGSSDLKLFDEPPPLHNIQRKLYRRNGFFGSIALIKDASISSITYKNCWTLSSDEKVQKYLFCDNTDSENIPPTLLERL